MKWYLDFGHGGNDSGAVGSNDVKESDVVLTIGMLVKENLEKSFEKVVTTREDDKYYSLDYRSNKANNENCDYFVSLHMNSFKNKETKGIEVLVYNLDSKLASLAKDVSSKLSKELSVLRKTKNI
jgi:N-acetylmuramoyl-L-alanine amidase